MSEDVLLRNKKLQVAVVGDMVSVRISCGDAYTAQVLFEDILERLDSGEKISFYGVKSD